MINWKKYKTEFRRIAYKNGYDKEYVKRCLTYAEKLYEKGFPIIYEQEHLAKLVGYSNEYLRRASNYQICFYREFSIPKKRGGFRKIDEPLPSLKEIQRWILDNILNKCKTSIYAKAYIKKRSIRSNARFHRKQEKVLSLDFKDFFPSLKASRVYTFFYKLGYCKSVVTMLTELCTLKKALPQGAPTSPALSNLLCINLDNRFGGYAKKNNIRYTRYADDITFSGNFDTGSIIHFVKNVLSDEDLLLNEEKTRLMLPHQRQEVTGIVVNEELQAPRSLRRELRKNIYYIEKFGLDSHMDYTKITKEYYASYLKGKALFVLFVNPYDKDAKKALSVLSKYR